MKKRRFVVGISLAAVVLLAGLTIILIRDLKSYQSELWQLRQDNQELNTGLDAAVYENSRLQTLLAGQEETVETLTPSANVVSQLEEGYAQRIRDIYSDSSMEVLGIYPVGEDTQESIRRFYLCKGEYRAEFYLVDYVTGEISDLGVAAGVIIDNPDNSCIGESKGVWSNGDVEWEFREEDYDGDGVEDILLVTTFCKSNSGGIMLWLQRQESFLPLNRYHCGNYIDWWQGNQFCEEILEKEEQFRKEQDQEAWSADRVGSWIREELFAGREDELEEVLQNPKRLLHYTQWREPLDIHVTLRENEQGQYRVEIPQNLYGEKRINEWIREFYEEEEEYGRSFMGVGIEDDNGVYLSERERQELGFYYNYGLWFERVDDVMICLISHSYEYSGGAHGNAYMYATTFDTQSGSFLELKDIVYDVESFCKFVMGYIDNNYEVFPWGRQNVRDALTSDGWCFTGYGFRVFLVGGNGLGYYWYEIPYELLLDYVKEEYLPVSRVAEYEMPYGVQESVQMDVNGDGVLDMVSPVREEEDVFWAVNGAVTKMELQWQGLSLKELDIDFWTRQVWLERQEDGVTRLFWEVSFYGSGQDAYAAPDNRVYVYRIEGENFVYEKDY